MHERLFGAEVLKTLRVVKEELLLKETLRVVKKEKLR